MEESGSSISRCSQEWLACFFFWWPMKWSREMIDENSALVLFQDERFCTGDLEDFEFCAEDEGIGGGGVEARVG
jgi:hypothetical protein